MAVSLLLLALHLVVLHRIDGGAVTVNPEQVTSLRVPSGPLSPLAPGGRCIIDLADRKFIAVLETCEQVRQKLEAPE